MLFSPYEAHVGAGCTITDITPVPTLPPPAAIWTTFQLDGDSDECDALETAAAWLSLTSIFPRQATSMAAGQTAAGAAGVNAVKWFVTRVKEWAAVHAGDWVRALGLHGPHRHQVQEGKKWSICRHWTQIQGSVQNHAVYSLTHCQPAVPVRRLQMVTVPPGTSDKGQSQRTKQQGANNVKLE